MKGGTALVVDQGLFCYVATALTESFERVLYFSTWHEAFPTSRKRVTGLGLPGVTRVNHLFDHIEDADLIVFPDVGQGDLQNWLRGLGKRVWGSASAEILELDRVGLTELMQAKKMDGTDGTKIVYGIDALEAHLRENDDQYVKLGLYRGDCETFHHRTWWLSEPWFHDLRDQVGPVGPHLDFVVEDPIEGVEVGYDGFCIDGNFPPITMYGYEAKDAMYVGRVCVSEKLPDVLGAVNRMLAPVLGELGCRSMFSIEVRVRPDGSGVLIDPTLRCGSPPAGVMLEMFSNWGDIMLAGADGVMVAPQPRAKFGAEIMLRSSWAKDKYLSLRFPESHRRWLKLHGHFRVDDVDWVSMAGLDIDVIGAAVGIGDTMREAVDQATEVAESVEGYEVTWDGDAFEAIEKQIQAGVKAGVNWD